MVDQDSDWPSKDRYPAIEDPLTAFARLVRQQLQAADYLEEIADSLPGAIDKKLCLDLAHHIPCLLEICWTIDESVIFPRLLTDQAECGFTLQIAERLSNERLMDQGYAIEVSDLLEGFGHSRPVRDANASGYLLRSFFESTRRSAAFELEFIVPAAKRCLTQSDREQLSRLLSEESTVVPLSCAEAWATIKPHKHH